jgi:putative addiction module CopG family antidote
MDRESIPISLSGEDGRFVQSQVASGCFHSPQEVLRHGLRISREQETLEEFIRKNKAAIRRKIERSAKQAERGELIDGEVFEAEVDRLDRVDAPKAGRVQAGVPPGRECPGSGSLPRGSDRSSLQVRPGLQVSGHV